MDTCRALLVQCELILKSCGALRRELHPDRVGDWYGLDTAIYKVAAVEVDGQALIKCPPESLSHQLNHRLKGRRC